MAPFATMGQQQIDQALTANHALLSRRITFRPASKVDTQDENLRKQYAPLNVLEPVAAGTDGAGGKKHKVSYAGPSAASKGTAATAAAAAEQEDDNQPPRPKRLLYQPEKIAEMMSWRNMRQIGPGLENFGNTCFLNSVLQVLTYTPPLANYLLSKEHTGQCRMGNQPCALCEMTSLVGHAHTTNSKKPARPLGIVSKLKVWGKHFKKGRQEDAHEFLRYFVDSMQKSCLAGLDKSLDATTKTTTFVHQTFGGLLRSQVKCTECSYESNTYDAALDLSLEVKHAGSLQRALDNFTKREVLDKANKYNCSRCKQKVVAHKRFTVHVPPPVLSVHFKRFDFTYRHGAKITRHVEFDETLDLAPYMSDSSKPVLYKLFGVIVHSGATVHSGHYTCFTRAPNGMWHNMDDECVDTVKLASVLRANAYMLFYQRVQPAAAKPSAPKEAVAARVAAVPGIAVTPPEAQAAAAAAMEEEAAQAVIVRREASPVSEQIAHISAEENRKLRCLNAANPRGTSWEVEDAASGRTFRVEVPSLWELLHQRRDAALQAKQLPHANATPSAAPAAPAAVAPASAPAAAAGVDVDVRQWDSSLRADDLAKRVRPDADAETPRPAKKAKWDGKADPTKVDVVKTLRESKFQGFGGQISTWDGEGASLVDTAKIVEPSQYRHSYTKDDEFVDRPRQKKVKNKANQANQRRSLPANFNVFQAAYERQRAKSAQ